MRVWRRGRFGKSRAFPEEESRTVVDAGSGFAPLSLA